MRLFEIFLVALSVIVAVGFVATIAVASVAIIKFMLGL